MRRSLPLLLAAVLAAGSVLCTPREARADLTAFVGTFRTTENQPVRGVSLGMKILLVGVEFEYAFVPEDTEQVHPSIQEGSAALIAETPTGRVKLYGVAGAGVYRERLGEATLSTSWSLHIGGGLKIGLAGPVGIRLDYRIVTLNGRATDKQQQRLYAGLNLNF
jgi:hypothetical protein